MAVYLLRKKKNVSWILLTSIFSLKFNHNFSPPLNILSNLPQVPLHSDTFRKAFGKMFKKKCWNIRCIIIASQLGQYHFVTLCCFPPGGTVLSTSVSDSILQIHWFTHPCEVIDVPCFAIKNGQKRSTSFLGLLV